MSQRNKMKCLTRFLFPFDHKIRNYPKKAVKTFDTRKVYGYYYCYVVALYSTWFPKNYERNQRLFFCSLIFSFFCYSVGINKFYRVKLYVFFFFIHKLYFHPYVFHTQTYPFTFITWYSLWWCALVSYEMVWYGNVFVLFLWRKIFCFFFIFYHFLLWVYVFNRVLKCSIVRLPFSLICSLWVCV